MATYVKSSRPTNGGNVNKNVKQREEGRLPTLQERKEKKYPFDDDDVQGIFDELMAAKAISPPKLKQPVTTPTLTGSGPLQVVSEQRFCDLRL